MRARYRAHVAARAHESQQSPAGTEHVQWRTTQHSAKVTVSKASNGCAIVLVRPGADLADVARLATQLAREADEHAELPRTTIPQPTPPPKNPADVNVYDVD